MEEIGYIEDDYVIYPFLNRKELDHPEEQVRLKVLEDLVTKYKYSKRRIDIEVLVPRRIPEDKADIVVFEDDEKMKPYIVYELKAEDCTEEEKRQAIEQAFGNAIPLNAQYAVFDCGVEERKVVFEIWKNRPLERTDNIVQDIPVNYGKMPEYKYIRGDFKWDLRTLDLNRLSSDFHRCHTILWGGGANDPIPAFDEMSKLLFAKLHDEKYTKFGDFYRFQIGTHESEEVVSERVKELYKEARRKDPSIFEEPIRANSLQIYEIVKILQGVSLRHTDLDAKGRAFETFLGNLFRGPQGQYFTPRQIVDFAVRVIKPQVQHFIIDPACGSGGFLLYSLSFVREQIQRYYGGDTEALIEFAYHHLYGIEKNERIACIAKMDMLINEDGHSNIEQADGLISYNLYIHQAIKSGNFEVALTNPPLSRNSVENSQAILKVFHLGSKDQFRDEQRLSILFIERCLDLIKTDIGKMAIVLDDGILKNASLRYVRQYILQNSQILAVVNLPSHTFIPSGSGIKASLVFLKRGKSDKPYPIFMGAVDHVGYDATGRPEQNDLEELLKEYEKFMNDPMSYQIRILNNKVLSCAISSHVVDDRLDFDFYHPTFLEQTKVLQNSTERVVPLENVCDVTTGRTFPKSSYINKPGVLSLKVINLTNQGINWGARSTAGSFVPSDFYDKYPDAHIQKNDILLTCSAHNVEYIAKKIDLIESLPPELNGKCLACGELMIIYPNLELIDPYYLLYFLRSPLGRVQMKRIITGQSAHLYPDDLKTQLKVILPPLPIQQKLSQEISSKLEYRRKLSLELTRLDKEINGIVSKIFGF